MMSRPTSFLATLLLALTSGFAAAADKGAELDKLYTDYWEEDLKLTPFRGTFAGDARYNADLPNFLSADHRDRVRAFNQKYLERVKAIGHDGLTGQQRLSYDVFVLDRESELADLDFPDHLQPVNQFRNLATMFAQLGSGSNAQPFATLKDYDDWLARASRAPIVFEQAIVNMREGIKSGVVQPRALMEKVLPQFDDLIVEDVEKSIFWTPVTKIPKDWSEADRARLTLAFRNLIGTQLLPAYRKLRAFIADEYLPVARSTSGLGALPNGAAWYEYRVRRNTTRTLSAAEVHTIGLNEVARIQKEMRSVARELGFARPDDLKGFFAWMTSRDDMYYKSREELLGAYQAFGSNVEPKLPKYFNLLPKGKYEIRLYEPFREASAAAGSYQGPSLDGKRQGIFYVNAYDLKARPRWALHALSLHEAAPGHHFQIALQRELKELPMFRRLAIDTAFAEGWGLYAEYLGYEMGIYKDPVARFGALDAELWRAIRLVSDTGLHLKGWSREQVIEYMAANSPANDTRAVSETERFMAIPGQALAYKIGQLKILELRRRAEKALGKKFSLVKFHDEVLRDGAVPLDVLEPKIDRWISTTR
jgi:uncharacterized protein (DUF885 family)